MNCTLSDYSQFIVPYTNQLATFLQHFIYSLSQMTTCISLY